MEALHEVAEGRIFASESVIQRMLNRSVGVRDGHANLLSPIELLTDRELDVLERIGSGHSIKTIAEDMRLSPKTVETYRDRIRQKLGIGSAHELKHYAFQWVKDHLG